MIIFGQEARLGSKISKTGSGENSRPTGAGDFQFRFAQ
jgi:hypothetical protein